MLIDCHEELEFLQHENELFLESRGFRVGLDAYVLSDKFKWEITTRGLNEVKANKGSDALWMKVCVFPLDKQRASMNGGNLK